ncbi:MAG: two-component system response regulator PrmA [Rhodoferax sp.]
MAHLLIIEDDPLLRDGLVDQLRLSGHRVVAATDGEHGLQQLSLERFDALVLDLGLPDIDGLTLLQSLRRRLPALPVLILTARDGLEDRIQGLNAGADDYLTKPFALGELQARLAALLRRARLSLPTEPAATVGTRHGRVRVDPILPQVWIGEQAVELTPREWALLSLLVSNVGRVVSREDVLQCWSAQPTEGAASSNTLEVYIHRLRRKLGDSELNIRNVRGLGYMLDPPST